jgi:hypothetical protein
MMRQALTDVGVGFFLASTNVRGYQDAADLQVATTHPGGCAPARTGHSVDVISQTSVCDRAVRRPVRRTGAWSETGTGSWPCHGSHQTTSQ